jgi:hypothetical protein
MEVEKTQFAGAKNPRLFVVRSDLGVVQLQSPTWFIPVTRVGIPGVAASGGFTFLMPNEMQHIVRIGAEYAGASRGFF